jgi:hypothetical protein
MDRICTSLSVYKNSSSYEVLLKLQKMICDFFCITTDTIVLLEHNPEIDARDMTRAGDGGGTDEAERRMRIVITGKRAHTALWPVLLLIR